jgi:hypothetical protein
MKKNLFYLHVFIFMSIFAPKMYLHERDTVLFVEEKRNKSIFF